MKELSCDMAQSRRGPTCTCRSGFRGTEVHEAGHEAQGWIRATYHKHWPARAGSKDWERCLPEPGDHRIHLETP